MAHMNTRDPLEPQNSPPRDVQDQPVRPDAEPALFDQYGTHESLRQD